MSRHITYDTEYRFDLLESSSILSMATAINVSGRPQAVSKESSPGPDKITLFICIANDTSFRAAVGWTEGNREKVKADSLGKYITMLNADLYAIRMAIRVCRTSLPETVKRCAKIKILSNLS